jgi:hypothetical protein
MPVTTKLTNFNNGVNQFMFAAIPGVAGNLVCTGVLLAKDRLLQVLAITHTTGTPTAAADLTSEFTISADNQINNTGGTATTGRMVWVLVARKK